MNKEYIRWLFMDVDGTLTDGKIYIGDGGEIFKAFCVKDGYAIKHILPEKHIVPVIITARKSSIVEFRAKELGIQTVIQGVQDKVSVLKNIIESEQLSCNQNGKYEAFAYIGDDLLDIPCMNICGIVGCPNDAAKEVKSISDFVSTKLAGNGAVREFIEWLTDKEG